jgi:hypothetical protein
LLGDDDDDDETAPTPNSTRARRLARARSTRSWAAGDELWLYYELLRRKTHRGGAAPTAGPLWPCQLPMPIWAITALRSTKKKGPGVTMNVPEVASGARMPVSAPLLGSYCPGRQAGHG